MMRNWSALGRYSRFVSSSSFMMHTRDAEHAMCVHTPLLPASGATAPPVSDHAGFAITKLTFAREYLSSCTGLVLMPRQSGSRYAGLSTTARPQQIAKLIIPHLRCHYQPRRWEPGHLTCRPCCGAMRQRGASGWHQRSPRCRAPASCHWCPRCDPSRRP